MIYDYTKTDTDSILTISNKLKDFLIDGPVFVTLSDEFFNHYKEVICRNSVLVVLKEHNKNNFLALISKKRDYISFVTGGIEINEDVCEAAKRETKEETGYTNFVSVNNLHKKIYNIFYAKHANKIKIVRYNLVLIEIEKLRKLNIDKIEEEKHYFTWMGYDQIYNCLSSDSNKYALLYYRELNGKLLKDIKPVRLKFI